MAIRSPGRLAERLLSVGSLGAVIGAAAAFDETFRGYVGGAIGTPAATIASAIERVHRVALSLMDAVGYQATTHAPLALLVVGAGALVLLMTRT